MQTTLILPEGHAWEDVNPTWLRGNEYAWECRDCHHVLVGVMEADGSIELLDREDIPECQVVT